MICLGRSEYVCANRSLVWYLRDQTVSLLLTTPDGITDFTFFPIRMPNCCAHKAHPDRLDQFTDIYFGFSFSSGSSGLAGQFQVVERESSTRRGRRAPSPKPSAQGI